MSRLHVRGIVLPEGEHRDLYVHDGRITADPIPDAITIAERGYVVPGLVDAHCHVGLDENGAVPPEMCEEQALADRAVGGLLLRDAGSAADTRWMDERVDLPRLIRAGRHIARPKRYIRNYAEEIEPDQLVAEVARQAVRGDGLGHADPAGRARQGEGGLGHAERAGRGGDRRAEVEVVQVHGRAGGESLHGGVGGGLRRAGRGRRRELDLRPGVGRHRGEVAGGRIHVGAGGVEPVDRHRGRRPRAGGVDPHGDLELGVRGHVGPVVDRVERGEGPVGVEGRFDRPFAVVCPGRRAGHGGGPAAVEPPREARFAALLGVGQQVPGSQHHRQLAIDAAVNRTRRSA